MLLRVKKLSDAAILPVRGSAQSAGYDLAAAQATMVGEEVGSLISRQYGPAG